MTRDLEGFRAWFGARQEAAPPDLLERLDHYARLVIESRSNLVSSKDRDRFRMRHLRECLDPGFLSRVPLHGRAVDVGSGGGLPGIPVALLRPDLRVDLTEPRQRKAAFLERTVLALKLPNVTVHPCSFEVAARRRVGSPWDQAWSRGLRWTPNMIQAAEAGLATNAVIVRFGPPSSRDERVTQVPLGVTEDRVVQLWPRETWNDLSEAD